MAALCLRVRNLGHLCRRFCGALVALVVFTGAAAAASPGCVYVNSGALNYSGPPLTAGLLATTQVFYAGDDIRLTYTTNNAKPLVTLEILHTSIALGLVITDSTVKSYTISGAIGATGSALLQAGYIDATAALTPSNSVTVALTCSPAPAPTSLAITSTTGNTVYGQGVTFTATASSIGGTPTGNVVFSIGGVQQPAATMTGGVATLTTSSLAVANYTVSASYAGSSNFSGSSATLSGGHRVNIASTTTALSSSPRPSNYGQPVTLTAVVSANAPSTSTPTGNVIFSIDGVDQPAVAVVAGTATLVTTSLLAGSRDIVAKYQGTTAHSPSSATLAGRQTVNAVATTTTLALSPNPSTFGQAIVATATVAATGITPVGNVVFTVDNVARAPVPIVGGIATLSDSTLAVGSHTISVEYFGTNNFVGSASAPSTQTVAKANTTTSVTGPGAIVYGQPAVYTANVISSGGIPTGTVTFSIDNVPQTPVTLVAGQAIFTASGLVGGTRIIEAHYNGAASFNASTGSLSGGQPVTVATTATALTLPAASSLFGEAVTVSAKVTSVAGTPDGFVVFTVDGTPRPQVPLTNAIASLTLTGLSASTHAISAAYVGTSSFVASAAASANHVVTPAVTITSVSGAPEPSVVGQDVTFTARITSPGGTPTGTVAFSIDGTVVAPSVNLVNGEASLSRSNLSIGNHPVSVTFSGSANFLASSGNLPGGQTVGQAATKTTLATSANTAAFGAPLSLTALVEALPPGLGTPMGSVTFAIDGVAQAAQPLINGIATLAVPPLAVGNHVITAVYGGDTLFGQSSDALAGGQTVTLAGTTASLTTTPEPSRFSDAITLHAEITSPGGVPTGNVMFTVGGVAQGPFSLQAGKADLVVTGRPVGSNEFRVVYLGSTSFAPSADAVATHQVVRASTAVSVTTSSQTAKLGEPLTWSIEVKSAAGEPDGTVDILIDGSLATSLTLVNGKATYSPTGLGVLTHIVQVNYSGSTNFAPSTGSLTGGQIIDKAAVSMVLSSSASPAIFGQPVTISALLSSGGGTPAGDVVFTVNGTTYTVTPSGGRADLPLSALEPGFYTVTASYAGNGSFASTTAALASGLTVQRVSSVLTLSGSGSPSVYGDPVTVNAVVTSTPAATGTVIFTVDGVPQPSQSLVNGSAALVLTSPNVGMHAISAAYSGDSHVTPSTDTLTGGQTVTAAGTSLVLSATPSTVEFGASVELLAKVGTTAGTPAGNVVFTVDGTVYPAIALVGGEARFLISSLIVGSHTVSAAYAAQNNHDASSNTLAGGVTVMARPTSILVSGPVGLVQVGDVATYTATLTSGLARPSGTVDFVIDGNTGAPITRPLAGGMATLDHSFLTGGNHSIVVNYGGSNEFAVSQGQLAGGQTIAPAATSTTLLLSAPSIRFGDTVTATATVTGVTSPVGTVEFLVDGTLVGTAMLSSGSASFDLSGLALGNRTIVARYGGSLDHDVSVDTVSAFAVGQAIASPILSVSPSTVVVGEPVYFDITVTTPHGAAAGSVTFTINGAGPVTRVLDADGKASYQTTFPAVGTYSIGASFVGDPEFASANATAQTVTVNAAPIAVTLVPNVPDGVLNEPYSGSVTPVGGTGPYSVAHTGGPLPPGLQIDTTTGAITGSPTMPGSYTFDVQATDANNVPVSGTYSITIVVPVIVSVSTNLANGVASEPYQSPVLVATGGAGPYGFTTSGTLPGGIAYNAVIGRIEGTATQFGTFTFDIIATDGNGVSGVRTYTLDFVAPNIQITGALPNGEVGVLYPTTAIAALGGSSPHTFALGADPLPAGLVLNATTGDISGTPTAAGTYSVTVVATDANGFTGARAYSLTTTIVPVVSLPLSLPNPREGRPYAQSVAAIGATAPYNYVVTRGTLPPGLQLDAATGVISGTPTSFGPADFDITATDSSTPSPRTGMRRYQMTTAAASVLTMTAPPALEAGAQGYSHAFAAQGGSGNYTYAIISGALPASLVFGGATGTISGESIAVGNHSIVVEVTDTTTGDTSSQGFVLEIDAPIINVALSTANADYGIGYSGVVSASGGQDTHLFSSMNLPAWLSLDASTGDLTGTPNTAGAVSFDIEASDSNGFVGTIGVTLNIAPPVITLSPLSLTTQMTTRVYNATIAASGGTSADEFRLISGALPPGIGLASAGVLSGTPTLEGSFDFDIEVKDDNGFTASRSYTIVITSHLGTATLSTSLPNWIAGENQSAPASVTNDPGAFTYAVVGGNLPTSVTLDPNTGILSGTATLAGDYTFTIEATKTSTGQVNQQSYVLSVLPPTHQAVGTLSGGVAGTPYPAETVSASGGAGPYSFGTATGLPDGLLFDPATGTLSGTPTEAGTFVIAIPVTDGNGFAGTLSYPLALTAPTITLSGGTLANGMMTAPYAPYQFSAAGNGAGTPTFAVTGGLLPPGMTLDPDGTLSGTPTTQGNYSFEMTATDANGFTGSALYHLTVDSNVGSIVLPTGLADWTYKVSDTRSVAAISGATNATRYTVTAGALPTGLLLDPITGVVSGAPTAIGNFSFVVTATDGALVNSEVISLNVLAPVLTLTGTIDPPARVGVFYSDDLDATSTGIGTGFTYAVDTRPPGLAIDSNGTLSGTPTAAGTYNFTITATDADGYFVRQSQTLTIAPAFIALDLPSTLPAAIENAPYSVTLESTNGTGPYSYVVTGPFPTGVSFDGIDKISGTPNATGTFTISVTVTDAAGNTGAQTYSFVVDPFVPAVPASTSMTVTVPPSFFVGETVTLSANVTSGSGTPYGLVTFTDSAGGVLGTAPLDGTGRAELAVTFPDIQSRTIAADFDGNTDFAAATASSASVSPSAATTTIGLSGTTTTILHGDPAVILATIERTAPATGTPGPGTIEFFLNGTSILSGTSTNGTLALAQLIPPGQHVLRVTYTPDAPATDASSSFDLPLTVEADTTVTVTGDPTSMEGAQTTFTAVVDTLPSHVNDPTGSVEFMAGTVSLGSEPLVNGTASLVLDTLSVGNHAIWVDYPGHGVFRARVSATIAHRVLAVPMAQQPTTATIRISTTTPAVSQVVTFGVDVTSGSSSVPTGQVEFYDSTSNLSLGTAWLDASGRAELDHVFSDIAPRTIEARYLRDPGFDPSMDSVAVAPVSAETSVLLSASPSSTLVGDTVTVTASVSRTSPASGTPSSAIVEFFADGVSIGMVSTNGGSSASLITNPLMAETVFTAQYKGPLDRTDAPSLAAPLRHTVLRNDVDLVLDVTSNGTDYFIDVTALPVSSSGNVPGGTLTLQSADGIFADQTETISAGAARFTVPAASFTAGLHVLTVQYGGDTYFNPSAGQVSHQVIGDTTVSLAMSPSQPVPGRTVSLSARVLSVRGGAMPTGSVQFRFLSATWSHDIPAASLVNGLAATSMVFLDATEGEMTVIYSGDNLYQSTAASPLRRWITMAPSLEATSTVLSSSTPAAVVGQPVTFSAHVDAANGSPSGSVVFYNGNILLGSAPVTTGLAQYTVAGFASGIHPITAYYAGTAIHAASVSSPINQRVLGADAVSFTMTTRPKAYVALGQQIEVVYTLSAIGGVDLTGIAMSGSSAGVACPQTTLGANQTMECLGRYTITEADMLSGRVDFPGTVTLDGIGAIVSGTFITLQAKAVAEQFAAMTEGFMSSRQKLLSSSLRLPDIFDRRRVAPGQRAGTVIARADGSSQVLAFSSSFAEVLSWGAAKAAENLGTSIALEPLPLNIWIDAQMTLHARDEDTAHWGDFSTLAMGADYLIDDNTLIGAVMQGDWMHDYSAKGEVSGSGYLAGIYGSTAVTEHISVDASVLYGQSQNEAIATMFDQYFSGKFETERLIANLTVAGWWEYDALTIRPDVVMSLSTEDGRDYFVRNEAGDAVLVEIDQQTEFRIGVGSAFEYQIDLEQGILTPKADFEVGISGALRNDAIDNSTFYGRTMLGLDFTTGNGLTLNGQLAADLDAAGFRSVTVRGGLGARF